MGNAGVLGVANVVEELGGIGQSLWLDNLNRSLFGRELPRWIGDGIIKGVTSNPTLFERALGSGGYDEEIDRLAGGGLGPARIYERLLVEDIQHAADLLRPVYERTARRDGYACLEVSPLLAYDTAATVAQAKAMWRAVGRPNLMIKVPGTVEGARAIAQLIDAGISVNVTLLFSLPQYLRVCEAYFIGIEARLKRGEPVAQIASVASFFVSRVDAELEARLPAGSPLRGRIGIDNCKVVYARQRKLLADERAKRLAQAGAQLQRLLWASTGTKNPEYRDVLYIEELIGADTVNTVPNATLSAFLDHGRVRPTLAKGVTASQRRLRALARSGIDLDALGEPLQRTGVELFSKSHLGILAHIERRSAGPQPQPTRP
jgi:transaldolase/glucose-6-phosphate isomerase